MDTATLAAIIFLATYAGLAFGGIPGLAIDRTGVALLGAIMMFLAGAVSAPEAASAIDMPTILLLYSLMVVSAQLRLGGFYTRVALATADYVERPERFLLILMSVSAVLSAVLANDIVCFAFTPVICVALLRAGLNPAPFLIGLACASNIGSAATVIGNPQNMLIGQAGGLGFGRFMLWCGPPAVLSLFAAYWMILRLSKGEFQLPAASAPAECGADWPEYDAHQSRKGLIMLGALVVLFFTPVPREVSGLIVAGLLLCSRSIHTRRILGIVDWHLITLFCALFVIVAAIGKYGLPEMAAERLAGYGMGPDGRWSMPAITLALSNLVSNVPAVVLLLGHVKTEAGMYVLALVSTFAGNLFIIGSIANLIVFEQARPYGIKVGFLAHARIGVPVTAVSLAIALAWAVVMGY